MILLSRYCKLKRERNENAEGWMGHLRIKANECGYKDKDRKLKEQFINGINYNDMMTEIKRKLTTIRRPMKSLVNKQRVGLN